MKYRSGKINYNQIQKKQINFKQKPLKEIYNIKKE